MADLRSVLIREGKSVRIERIEIELLDSGSFRWNLWRQGKRIYSSSGNASDVAGMLQSTEIITRTTITVNHEESSTGVERTATEGS